MKSDLTHGCVRFPGHCVNFEWFSWFAQGGECDQSNAQISSLPLLLA